MLLPIIRLEDPDLCRRFGQVLYAAGFDILEITLTTPRALHIIEEYVAAGICTGAGTVITAHDAHQAIAHGAQFLISPGLSLKVAAIASEAKVPYIPGVYTPTEITRALSHGLTHLKFFPAMPGGPEYLGHLQGPFPQVKWIPTGGIAFEAIPDYLHRGVLAVGQGTRLVNRHDLMSGNWPAVKQQLKQALAQVKSWKQDPDLV